MVGYNSDLQRALTLHGKKLWRPESTVLFRRGDKAKGMFFVLSGKVRVDFGVDSAYWRTYGPGALVGLPSTLTRRPYNLTATVTEDAELVFWSPQDLNSLLRKNPELCHEVLAILGEKMAENQEMAKALLSKDEQRTEQSTVV
jgi:CRP-like cAMP-binding protein